MAGLTWAGAVSVVYGSSPNGLSPSGAQYFEQGAGGMPGTPDAWTTFGGALAAGDFDADGYADLAISAPRDDYLVSPTNELDEAGKVFVLKDRRMVSRPSESPPGIKGTRVSWPVRSPVNLESMTNILGAPATYDYHGASLAAGDFQGDGWDDLAVGVPGENERANPRCTRVQ